MRFLDIALIIISSAGLLHGVVFAFYLMAFKKRRTVSNFLLGLILIFMAFRIGKSVMLNFGTNLEPIFIFSGLALLLLIGPLFRWYFLSMTQHNFKLTKKHIWELVPFLGIFLAGAFIARQWDENSRLVIIVFSSALIFIYLHLASYIFLVGRKLRKMRRRHTDGLQTKSQRAIFQWLRLLVIGFSVIWISYVMNILDDAVPYILGPIVYSLVIYFLSFKAFQLKAMDLDGDAFKTSDDHRLYQQILDKLLGDKLYLESDLSLGKLGDLVGRPAQTISAVVNQYAERNFNDFINYYRIQEAKKKLSSPENDKFTISAIAFDMGFSSLSSFNSAFKKFEGTTPSSYRKK